MRVYADTSFLVSLYSLDTHSAKAAGRVRRFRPAILLTPLAELELANALELRIFRKEASAAEIHAARTELQKHIEDGFFALVAMPLTVYDLAQRIARRRSAATGARTLDILHVAGALLLSAEQFWTFDERQGKIARAEGLHVR